MRMENLSDRFDNLQQQLLEHYERGSHNLTDQIDYWDLRRKENVILHYARRQGIAHLGYAPVPSLACSETNAKKAILMGLMLKSLQNTPFAQESWSMTETSIETMEAPPRGLLKKRPRTVDVWFDKNPKNSFPYVLWSEIYFQNLEGHWVKTEGRVDYDGLYYVDTDGELRYYCKFDKDALRYGQTGQWSVQYGNKTIVASVSSSSPEEQLGQAPRTGREGSPAPTTSSSQQRPQGRPQGQGEHPQCGSSRGTTRRTASPRNQGEASQGRGRGRGGGFQEEAHECRRSTCDIPTLETPGVSGGESRRVRGRGRGRRSCPPPRLSPYTPIGRLGRGHRGFEEEDLQRPGPHQAGPGNPPEKTPIALFRGDGNVLKCWRWRLKHSHGPAFEAISTAFSWIEKGGPNRVGRHRLLIGFADSQQMNAFLTTVKIPRGVDWSTGTLDAL
ncbi:E2 protein [Felis catus papillomavirus 6]|uniref:Regulatory protein E2 n=1 Tax=Felis catus papillomavirus 6 TaxID=2704502 RepID=A0A6B9WF57_9PAPI|nr:E2 protein [Felis catus papillomavirus 6]